MEKNFKNLHSKEIREIIDALDNSSIVAVTDIHGIITYVNKKFCDISKYSQEELINQNHRILKSGYHPSSFYKNLWLTISNGDVWGGDIKNKAKDGSYYWVRTIITPILDKNGKPDKYIAIRTVVSEEKLAEEKANMKAQKIEMKKLISEKQLTKIKKIDKMKDEFVAMISHELKNPLIPIMGNCEILNDPDIGGKLTSTQKKLVQDINDGALRLEILINELLDLQQINLKKMHFVLENIYVKKLVSKLLLDLSSIFKEKEIFIINSCKNLSVNIDRNRIRQVLENLVKNAVDFVPERNATIEIGCTKENNTVVFFVKDNG
ncbi:MAG: PAS domain-containing sensor histidine kinase, partial [Nitrosopumilus sp.]|nr:PAS domain-containing sensor histidine kinase [Nitrosopumilus sp.]